MNFSRYAMLVTTLVLLLISGTIHAETTFTYQGRLGNAGVPADGPHDFVFRLFDAETNGTQVGGNLSIDTVDVTEGVFTVQLDFGDAPFNAAPRWLEIDVRESGTGAYSTLAPRNRIGASPFAVETLFVAPGAVDTAAIQDEAVTRAKLADNSVGTFQIENNTVSSSDIRDGAVSSVDVQDASLTTADLAAGIYRTKGDLYVVAGTELSIGLLPQSQTVACADVDDLPLTWTCSSQNNSFLATHSQAMHWASEVAPAEVTCSAVNVHPSDPNGNPVLFRASITCIDVP